MKPHLMFYNKDLDLSLSPETGTLKINSLENNLIYDLKLNYIIEEMSNNDDFIKTVSTQVLISPLNNIEEIKYRQNVLKDIIKNNNLITELYKIANETEEKVRFSRYSINSQWVSGTFNGGTGLINIYFEQLIKIKQLGKKYINKCKSEALLKFFNFIINTLSDNYISTVKKLLNEMNESNGILISGKFGNYLQGVSYTYRKQENKKSLNWAFVPSFNLPERDDISSNDISLRRDRAINETTNILGKTAESLGVFFYELKKESAFYTGCLTLYKKIKSKELNICFPELKDENIYERTCIGLYDLSLGLYEKNETVTDNDYSCNNKILHIITGANQGGKTTFVISIGQAQILAQCGIFVPAKSFISPVKNHIYTHFKKDEDNNMNSGKLDEELNRMNKIILDIKENDLIIFNDSFSSTNEQEGSDIFTQITNALTENNVEIFSVTHLYDYSESFLTNNNADFLQAHYKTENEVPYKITKGSPSETAFGEELYNKIFHK